MNWGSESIRRDQGEREVGGRVGGRRGGGGGREEVQGRAIQLIRGTGRAAAEIFILGKTKACELTDRQGK
jgi:hypothetical protein